MALDLDPEHQDHREVDDDVTTPRPTPKPNIAAKIDVIVLRRARLAVPGGARAVECVCAMA